jgi:hypothetical protein
MDVKRLGNVLHAYTWQLAEADGGGLEVVTVSSGGSWTWLGHGGTPERLVQGVH